MGSTTAFFVGVISSEVGVTVAALVIEVGVGGGVMIVGVHPPINKTISINIIKYFRMTLISSNYHKKNDMIQIFL